MLPGCWALYNDLGFVLSRDLDHREVATAPVTITGDPFQIDLLTVAWKALP